MNSSVHLLFRFALVFAPVLANAATVRDAQIDAVFQAWSKADSPGAAVAVIEHGKIVFEQGYGIANLEYGIPIQPASIFHVASVSKQFTAMAVVLLEADGKLKLDDDVHRYLPELADFGHRLTLRHLLQHTSGIRDQWQILALAGWSLQDVITQDQILRMLFRQQELNFPPGTKNLYSNGGFTLLAEIVARVSGRPFPQFCTERIFVPLGMTRTHFHQDLTQLVPNRAYSYHKNARGYASSPLNYANVGATSLFTTAGDLVRWLDNFREPKVGGAAGIARLQERGVLLDGKKIDYGLGIGVGAYRGLRTLSHSGSDAGYRSHVLWFPEAQLGIAVVSNLASFNPDGAAKAVAALFLEGKLKPVSAQPAAPATKTPGGPSAAARASSGSSTPLSDFKAYAGSYWSEEVETQYTFFVRDGKLFGLHAHHGEFPLTAVAPDQFSSSLWFTSEVKFRRDAAGQVSGVTLGGGRVNAVRFTRR